MAFTYDISDTADISSHMRLELGDTVVDPAGMLPEGRNFQDAELDWFYSQEDSDFWPAIARAFDAAAAEWSKYPTSFSLGPESQKIDAAKYFSDRADAVRTKRAKPGSISIAKVDYGIDVDA